jgi:site-specific DNA recombinase
MITQPPIRYAAIYVRVSTEDQGKGFSIPTQLEACQKLAEREGYTVPESHRLVDEGLSGTTMDRPGLRTLRDLVTSQAITAAVVYDPDRLSRNLGHQLLLAEEFEQAGVTLLIVSHPLEQGPEGWLFFQMRGALAECERAKILERTRRGTVGRIQAGHPGGGNAPLGYRYIAEPHGGLWEINDEAAALVRRIFALCLRGESTRGIARILTEERVSTPSDRHPERGRRKSLPHGVWSHPTVRAILTYQGYTGEAAWGKRERLTRTTTRARPVSSWVSFRVPPIIDPATFEAAQHALRNHQRWATRNRKREYLLTGGVLTCGRCGRTMSGTCRRREMRYYRCGSWLSVLDPALRCAGSVRADGLEAQVWTAVVHVLEQPELIAAEIRRQEQGTEAKRAEIGHQLALIDAALAKCERESQRWADAYAAEVINMVELKGYRVEIEARRQSLLREQAEAQQQLDAIGEAVQHVEALTGYCTMVHQCLQTFDHTEKRKALQALNIRVSWTPGQALAIQGSIPMDAIADTTPWRS